MSWVLEVSVQAVEAERDFTAGNERVKGVYTFKCMPANGTSLAAAWAAVEGEIHSRFLSRLEPSKGDA